MIKKTPWNFCIHYITWLMKTHKSTTKGSFVEIVVLRLTVPHSLSYDIGSKRTNNKFGCFSEIRQSYSIKDSLYLKMYIYIYIYIYIFFFFFQKVGAGAWPLSPSRFAGPDMKTLRY